MENRNKHRNLNPSEIEKIFGARFEDGSDKKPEWLCESPELSLEDQKWILNNVHYGIKEEKRKEVNNNVNGNVNGIYKRGVNFELNKDKHQIITELKQCNYRTPPKKIASLLEELFIDCLDTTKGHWLFIAQHWPPKAINGVIKTMIKQHQGGEKTIKNVAAYFTYLIKFRKKRKCFRTTIGSYKQQNASY